MSKLYHTNQNKFIIYNRNQINKKTNLCVIFLHGLLSNKNGTKAIYLEKYCTHNNIDFIRFDNFGHGESSGQFLDQTIGSWLEGLEFIVNQLTQGQQLILIGSSMGGWIALLFALKYPQIIEGLIGIAAAPDFTEEAIWQKLPPVKQQEMRDKSWMEVAGSNCSMKYPISYNLITEAKNHLLLTQDIININCPVHLIHGLSDLDIPYSVSERLFIKITSKNMVLKLIKEGDHRLSTENDLKIITNSLAEITSLSAPL